MAIGNYLTVAEAAHILRVSEIRVRQFFNQNRIPGTRIGQQILLEADKVAIFSTKVRHAGRPKQVPEPAKSKAKSAPRKTSRQTVDK